MYISKNEVCSVNLLKSPCQKNYYPIRLVASYLLAARLARASNVRRTMRHSVSEDCVKAAKTTYLLRASAPNQTRFAGLRFGIGIFSVKLRQKGHPIRDGPFWRAAIGIRIMSAHAGGVCMSQCAHWRIPICFARDERHPPRTRFPAKHANESLIAYRPASSA